MEQEEMDRMVELVGSRTGVGGSGWGCGGRWISEAVLARALFVVCVACWHLGVCPLALCGEMLTLVKEPLYLRRRWEDIGGSPPPSRGPAPQSKVWEEPLTGAMEVARSGQTSGPLRCPEKVECGAALESKVEEPGWSAGWA